jgi:hypothetical protein
MESTDFSITRWNIDRTTNAPSAGLPLLDLDILVMEGSTLTIPIKLGK